MTNLQLLLSIGVPCLLIALSIFQNNVRFTALERRLDGVDTRLIKTDTATDARFEKAEAGLRAFRSEHHLDLAAIDADLRTFRSEHHLDLVAVHADLKQFYGMTTKLEGRMDEISKR